MDSSSLLLSPDIQNAYLASIVESSDDAIVGKDLNSIVTSWNSGAERIFGYSAAEMIGKSITLLIPRDRLSEEDEILARIRAGDKIDHFETIRMRKDGREINVSVTVSAIKNGQGTVVGASKVARDITLLKQIERERGAMLQRERALRERAEKADRIKDEFLATLSHELRTPLSAILGWLEILRGSKPEAEELTEGLDVISRNARAQAQLVDDLLDMNRILMGKIRLDVQMVDLPQIVEAAIQAARPPIEAKRITLRKVIDPLAGPVRGDPGRLQQIVWNLLTNASKFTSAGGRIEVALGRVDSHVEISVADSGIGIRPQNLDTIFDRFSQIDSSTTRRHSGLGLGLSIVKHLVELQGGGVSAESPGEGKGSTFRVTLPRPLTAHDESGNSNLFQPRSVPDSKFSKFEWVPPNLKGKRALVVDDDRDNAGVIRRLLEQCGAVVELATGGKEAIGRFGLSHFDVIISDVGMPEMDGFEFIRQVRGLGKANCRNIPSIALTAFSRPDDRKMAIIAGFDVYLSKPADAQELLSIVERFTRRQD